MSTNTSHPGQQFLPPHVAEELDNYEQQIRKYRAGKIDETKMQKLRLHFGTYAQRQEGVQMQRVKIPGGFLSANQLLRLADAADRFGSGFMHFTTREDAQIYYVKLDETPDLLRLLGEAGITSREACGNTVRNITACYRSGTSPTEAFDVAPYAEALFQYLVRNKYNQNLGRKFKITFEGCSEDHSALRLHDIGLWARTTKNFRGFRVYLGGGLGADPHLAYLYTDFLPADEILNLAAAILRLFDRYGERKARMKARMKFLIQGMGWGTFRTELEKERDRVGPIPINLGASLHTGPSLFPTGHSSYARGGAHGGAPLHVLQSKTDNPNFLAWATDSVIEHKWPEFRGVHVRIKLGDLTSDRARGLAEAVKRFSAGQLRISIEQNVYLPWVRQADLWELYLALGELSLAEFGVGTVADVTTCPGSDTCRLGIASAKGLGSALSDGFSAGPLSKYAETAKPLKIKVSGCPNGCAQHSIASIGFYAAALSNDGRTVPAHFVTVGGQTALGNPQFGKLLGKFPAKNCVKVTQSLLELYEREKLPDEEFNPFVDRVGIERLKNFIEPLKRVPSFNQDPSFYEDYGHEHESFAVRKGVKGECAGSTVAETVPTMDIAKDALAQAEALIYHKEYRDAVLTAYAAAAAAARVPLHEKLVDPLTSEEALWEFENLLVLSGETNGEWAEISTRFDQMKFGETESGARRILDEARSFVAYCSGKAEGLESELQLSPR
ncbi:MAG: nitrite/sulfite reductase [Pyrinomonadaceae bacterium]